MKVWEYDLRLYGVLKACVEGYLVSPLRDQPDDAMWAGLQRSFKSMRVGKPHRCGSSSCRSFFTTVKQPRGTKTHCVRFDVCGELTVKCDAAGTVYYVEWLPDDLSAARNPKRYRPTAKGWASGPVLLR